MSQSTEIIKNRYKLMSPHIIQALNKRGYEAFFCETAEDATEKILSLIPESTSVSWGGSMTLEEIGILERLKQGNYEVIDRDTAASPEERTLLMKKVFFCDTYLSSVNAMSEDGVMINIDGTGNRIAAIAYGPKNVILVIGMNKICQDTEAARQRAKTYAAPNNSLRLSMNLPCAKTGICYHCNSPESICSQIVEMHRNRIAGRIKIILVGENLGL